jgi:tetratricopeptide (TPR) repeat protein
MSTIHPDRIFISPHDDHLRPEYEAAKRVVGAFTPHTPTFEDSQLYIGIFGIRADPQTLAEFEQAMRGGKICWVFVKAAPPEKRDPDLNNLLRLVHQLYPTQTFENVLDLSHGLYQSLWRQRESDSLDAWLIPPLPIRDPAFVQREAELEKLIRLLDDSQPVALSGISGSGKTVLAKELAARVREKFPGGIFWLESFGMDMQQQGQSTQQVFRQLAGAHPAGRATLKEGSPIMPAHLQAWLADAPDHALVIADNIRHVAPLRDLRMVLPSRFKLLITTPQPLTEIGWQWLDLAPLRGMAGLHLLFALLDLPPNLADEAVRPLENIVDLLGGHPLSLRLAAGWMGRAGGWQSALIYLKRLTESTKTLRRIAPDLPHEKPVEKALGLIYNSLPDSQKMLFRYAGAFAPNTPFTADTLIAVSGLTESTAEIELMAPVLFTPDEAAGGYRLHSQVHTYAEALLGKMGELEEARLAHLQTYQKQAAAWHNQGRDPNTIPPDLGQLRYAFAYAQSRSPYVLAEFVLNAGQYLHALHYNDELRSWLEVTKEAVSSPETRLTVPQHAEPPEVGTDRLSEISPASNFRALGDLCMRIKHLEAAQVFYDHALLMYFEARSLSGQANTLKSLGDLRAEQGKLEEAQEYYDRTLLLYAQIDFQLGRANTVKAMGDLSLQRGDRLGARTHYQRTLELYEQIDFQLGQAHTLRAMADLYAGEHDLIAARDCYEQALHFYEEIGFHSQQAETLVSLGNLYMKTKDIDEAEATYQDALRLYTIINDSGGQASTLEALGAMFQGQRQYQDALRVYEQARDLYLADSQSAKAAELNLKLSVIYMAVEDYETALRLILQSLRVFHQLDDYTMLQTLRRHLREMARQIGSAFDAIWERVTTGAAMPDWLKLAPASTIPQELVYAVRDFMLARDLETSQQIVIQHQDILLTDEADEVFARMLRQYAGQTGPIRQIDRYRALLYRCREIGIEAAFQEAATTAPEAHNHQVNRLRHSLDAYDEALQRLGDIPLVYAGIQLNRAKTLRELAAVPGQDKLALLKEALTACSDALPHQESTPHDYAHTQIYRAEILRELADLPYANRTHYLREMLGAYTDALQYQHDLPKSYAHTQLSRAAALHELAKLPEEDAMLRMREALAAYDDALAHQLDSPEEYAYTQSHRAQLLYEMATLPGEDHHERMRTALKAYDEALDYLRDEDPVAYAITQSHRIALLRDMAGLPGEDRTARLYQALAACNESLRFLTTSPQEYTQAQIHRAHLLREIAGLRGEHRLARMRESLATFTEVLSYLGEKPLDYATIQNSRAALLREMALLAGENKSRRLHESLEAAADAILLLEKTGGGEAILRNARRMMIEVRREVLTAESEETFDRWWREIVGTPQPDWLTG